jgi:LruC domain-containing protein
MTIIVPNASYSGSGGGLSSGDKVYLGSFTEDTGIGWFLVPNGWNSSTQQVDDRSQIKYSIRDFNTFTGTNYRQHMVLLNDEERELLLLGMEDTSRPAGDNDFNDAIFYVTANPYTAIVTDDFNEIKAAVDTDEDGVFDGYDDYPEDPLRAYKSVYPSENTWSTLAYEDRWPNQGDYDFNDVVLDYQFEYAKNASNTVVDMIIRTKLQAVGGEVKSGFLMELNLPSSAISMVEHGQDITQSYITLNPNGTEASQSKAVIPIFQDAKELMPAPTGYSVTNVIEGQPYVEPVTIETRVYFQNPVSLSSIGSVPYNPFIVTTGNRGNEIHLPGNSPTNLADISLFGTGDDATDINTDYLYKNANGAPWALHIPQTFDYPKENVNIVNSYAKFTEWVENSGYSYSDWYQNKNGYRNSTLIYSKQLD